MLKIMKKGLGFISNVYCVSVDIPQGTPDAYVQFRELIIINKIASVLNIEFESMDDTGYVLESFISARLNANKIK